MSANPAARLEREDGGLAVITLDSPPLNLFDQRMFDDLRRAIDEVVAEPPRALLIRAEGRAVSGGVDVHVFAGLSPEQGRALWDELLTMIEKVEELPAPVVFAAHALTLTAAFELSLACDLIVASPQAKFGLVEKVVGLTPSMGGTQRIAEPGGRGPGRHFVMSGGVFDAPGVGARGGHHLHFVMSGGIFDAAEMERWGVVNLIFEDHDFDEAARKLAQE